MSDIKLYGKVTNGDGNLLISPLEVAGVDTKGNVYSGKANSTNNIISYINSKTGAITPDTLDVELKDKEPAKLELKSGEYKQVDGKIITTQGNVNSALIRRNSCAGKFESSWQSIAKACVMGATSDAIVAVLKVVYGNIAVEGYTNVIASTAEELDVLFTDCKLTGKYLVESGTGALVKIEYTGGAYVLTCFGNQPTLVDGTVKTHTKVKRIQLKVTNGQFSVVEAEKLFDLDSINTKLNDIKTGIKSVEFGPSLSPESNSQNIKVTAKDGTFDESTIGINPEKVIQFGSVIPKTTKLNFGDQSSPLADIQLKDWNGSYTSIGTVNITMPSANDVGAAWSSSTAKSNYTTDVVEKKDTQVLNNAKEYTDEQIGAKLGKVYKPQGNANLATIVTINPSTSAGNVWNMTEEFKIDGKVYPQYTNIVIVDGVKDTTLKYDTGTKEKSGQGFSGTIVDALGGMFDQSALEEKINTANNEAVKKVTIKENKIDIFGNNPNILKLTYTINGVDKEAEFTPIVTGVSPISKSINDNAKSVINTISGEFDASSYSFKLTYTYTDDKGNVNHKSITPSLPIASENFKGIVQIGDNIDIDSTGKISVPVASKTTYGVVKVKADGGINVSNGEISVPKNSFTDGTGISINKSGNDFTIGFNTTYTSTSTTSNGKPLYYNAKLNGFYVNTDTNLSVTTDTDKSTKIGVNVATLKTNLGLNSKADASAVTALEKRVEALESLLSLG